MSRARRRAARHRPHRPRGAALVLVLWLLVLLAAIIAALALASRTEWLQGRHEVGALRARAAAEAGIELAVTRMLDFDVNRRWRPDGRPYALELDGIAIEVRVQDETGKVDLNTADALLLAGLVEALGEDRLRASSVAAAILDWRDPDPLISPGGGAEDDDYARAGLPWPSKDQPFESVDELQRVLGVDAGLYARMLPHVGVHGGVAQPDVGYAPRVVLEAMGLPPATIAQVEALRGIGGGPAGAGEGAAALAGFGSGTYSVESRATLGDGTRVVLHATLRVGPTGVFGQLYTPLEWREGDPR